MKKNFLLLMFCMLTASAFCQRSYEFDYVAEYDLIDGKKENYFIVSNSADNSYVMYLFHKDSTTFDVQIHDQNGIRAAAFADKQSFWQAGTITIDCDLVYQNKPNNEVTPYYRLVVLSDTIIENVSHKRYSYTPVNPKKNRKHNRNTATFIIEPETEFHLPIFRNWNMYNFWKAGVYIPPGLIKSTYYDIYKDRKRKAGPQLLTYTKIKKSIVVPQPCPYRKKNSKI